MSNQILKQFKPIELSDKDSIEKYILNSKNLSCEYSFPNLFIWREIYNTCWTESDGHLLICYEKENGLLMPLPNPEPEKLVYILKSLGEGYQKLIIAHPQDDYINKYPNLSDFFHIERNLNYADYIHKTVRLIELKGRKLAKKKNLIAQFRGKYPDYTVKKISPNIFSSCLELAKSTRKYSPEDNISIINEESALKEAFANFDNLALNGIAIFADSKLVAFNIFSGQNLETCIVHFEKSDKNIKGSSQMIVWEGAKAVFGKYQYINREQDLGVPGLCHAKSSYDPDFMLGGILLTPKI